MSLASLREEVKLLKEKKALLLEIEILEEEAANRPPMEIEVTGITPLSAAIADALNGNI